MMNEEIRIVDYMNEKLINLNLNSKNRDEVLFELSELLEKSENINSVEKDVYKALVEREKLGSTGIGKGVAIPHAKTESASKLTIALGISRKGIDFNSLDDEDINLFFVFASPNKDSRIYLKVLARISRLIREKEFRDNLMKCSSAKQILECISEREN